MGNDRSAIGEYHRLVEDFTGTLPCVIYECDATKELIFISENIRELIGFDAQDLLGSRALFGRNGLGLAMANRSVQMH